MSLKDMTAAEVSEKIMSFSWEEDYQETRWVPNPGSYGSRYTGGGGHYENVGDPQKVTKSYDQEGGWAEFFESLYSWDDKKNVVSIPGVGDCSSVSSYGGEGQGDEYWFVFSVTDGDTIRLFRMDGYYASYSGGEYDGELYEVKAVTKEVVFYE